MNKNTSKEDTNLIAIYDGVLYEYHDGSWNEIESWSTEDELCNEEMVEKSIYTSDDVTKEL